jgi:exodeoxyribonuclease V alpha subunit
MPAPQEITAVYLREKSGTRRDAWAVHVVKVVASTDERLRVGDEIDVAGNCELSENDGDPFTDDNYTSPDPAYYLTRGIEYRFYGNTKTGSYKNKRTNTTVSTTTFHFTTFVRSIPHTREAVVRYLQECDHVGPFTAGKIFDKFGADSVRILRETPEVVAATAGIKLSAAHATAAAARLAEMAAIESVTMEMMDLLGGYGLPKATARECIRKWHNLAPTKIKLNPYLLMGFRGIGFLKADKVYLSLGLPAGRIKRQALCAWHALNSDTEGNTWLPLDTALNGIRKNVGTIDLPPTRRKRIEAKYGSVAKFAVAIAARAGLIARRTDDAGKEWASDGQKAKAENRLAELVLAAMDEPTVSPWSEVLNSPQAREALATLTDHQRAELTKALHGRVAILGGSPGCGKTYTAAALMGAIVEACGGMAVTIAAPTGKAAVRCTEAMAAYGLPLRAKTIHSLLKVSSADNGNGAWGFQHHEANPLPYRFIVVDESSMIDVPLMASLFAARAKGTAMLLIGDVNQLPPVGHGAPLRDLIAAGVPSGELTEIKRNAGTIVRACAAIRDGKTFPTDAPGVIDIDAEPPRNLIHIPSATPQATIEDLMMVLRTTREGGRFDAVWDLQVVVAVNKKSPVSRAALNELLQAELNPTGLRVEGSPFRVGDKVIQTKNQFYKVADPANDDKPLEGGDESFVANGEFGRVVRVEPKKTVVVFPSGDSPRRVVIPRGKAEGENEGGEKNGSNGDDKESAGSGCNLDLGYAATCHKMQGSQAPIVVVVLDEYPGASGKHGVAKREWAYTAISRAEKLCYLLGKMSVAHKMMAERSLPNRKTMLAATIEAGRLWSSRAWWVVGGGGDSETTTAPVLSLPSVNQTELAAT